MLEVSAPRSHGSKEPPLCVDLDGTLVRSDTLLEMVAVYLKAHPARVWLLPVSLLRGRAAFKSWLASKARIDAATLPYNQDLLDLLRREHARGRTLVLVTAADLSIARAVAAHLGIFDEIIASDGKQNVKGTQKRDKLVQRFGANGFDYAGDARSDLPVFRAARTAMLVNAPASVARAAPAGADRSLAARPPLWPALLRAMRPHQWMKNLLIFVPLLLAHRFLDVSLLARNAVAFVAFSLCASGIYLINDFFDLASDRAHQTKCRRPIASGQLPMGLALAVAVGLVAVALVAGYALSIQFGLVVAGYLLLTLAYSFSLKRFALLDVVVLASLYVSRLIAGGVAAHVVLSFWLMAFALFMFASLALLKRYSELIAMQSSWPRSVNGRDYATTDSEMIAMFGIGSGYIAVLVVALYIHGDLVGALYANADVLWAIAPLLLYWVSRAWLIAHRGGMHEDPVLFALKDRTSLVIALLCLLLGVLATVKLPFSF